MAMNPTAAAAVIISGRWTRVRTLGRGASGAVVSLAADDATGALFAVKSAPAGLGTMLDALLLRNTGSVGATAAGAVQLAAKEEEVGSSMSGGDGGGMVFAVSCHGPNPCLRPEGRMIAAAVEAQSGGEKKRAAMDAALENFKHSWELFYVAYDYADELVKSIRQRISSECLVDEAKGSVSAGSVAAPGINLINAGRLEQKGKSIRWLWLVIQFLHGANPISPSCFAPIFLRGCSCGPWWVHHHVLWDPQLQRAQHACLRVDGFSVNRLMSGVKLEPAHATCPPCDDVCFVHCPNEDEWPSEVHVFASEGATPPCSAAYGPDDHCFNHSRQLLLWCWLDDFASTWVYASSCNYFWQQQKI